MYVVYDIFTCLDTYLLCVSVINQKFKFLVHFVSCFSINRVKA